MDWRNAYVLGISDVSAANGEIALARRLGFVAASVNFWAGNVADGVQPGRNRESGEKWISLVFTLVDTQYIGQHTNKKLSVLTTTKPGSRGAGVEGFTVSFEGIPGGGPSFRQWPADADFAM